MKSSRNQIMKSLRRLERPFPISESPEVYLPMVPQEKYSRAELQDLFIREAQKAACSVYTTNTMSEAVARILDIVGADETVSCWDLHQIPLGDLESALKQRGIECVGSDPSVRVGLTGVDAALAATGSIVLSSGNGRHRSPSLLPPVHIAVVLSSQIVSDLEGWVARQKEAGLNFLRQSSNIAIITGPSRTADIAMQLVMGMHGPCELHIVLLDIQV